MNKDSKYAPLRLDSQLCFPLYALSRVVTAQYQPLLAPRGLTYPQYLVLMVLWEEGSPTPVARLCERLMLRTSTLTPLLKRMEQDGWIRRRRCQSDERVVEISLTPRGQAFRDEALTIPCTLSEHLLQGPLSQEELLALKVSLDKLIDYLK